VCLQYEAKAKAEAESRALGFGVCAARACVLNAWRLAIGQSKILENNFLTFA
jgi:hypothetical protein